MGRIWIPGGGGGADLGVITAAAGDIRAGKVIVDKDGEPLTGTLVDNGRWSSSGLAAGASVTIPAGIHDGNGTVTAKSLASQTPGNLAAGKMLSGVYGYSNGTKVTGSIASMGAQTVTPGNAAKTVSCEGKYMTGNVTVSAVANLTAANIKKGVTVGGVTGTWEGYVAGTNDLYKQGANPAGFVVAYSGNTLIFETAMMTWKTTGGTTAVNYGIDTTRTYNLTGYTKLYMEFILTASTARTNTFYLYKGKGDTKFAESTTYNYDDHTSKQIVTWSFSDQNWTDVLRLARFQGMMNIYRIWLA